MSNEAGRILLAILHGKPIPPSSSTSSSSQRRHRTPFSGFRDSFGGPSTRGGGGHLFHSAPTQQQPSQQQHHHNHHHNHPLPYFRVPNNSSQSSHFQPSINHQYQPHHHLNTLHNNAPQRTLGMDINSSYRPIRRYTREVMLSYADSDSSRRLPRRLELAFEMYPAIRRKRFGDLMNPYYYDPASAYSLGPTQLWDSELQQWVVMGHK